MARKVVLLLIVLGAGLVFAWYFSVDSQSVDSQSDTAGLPSSANVTASPLPATLPPVSSSNQSVAPAAREPDPLAEPSMVGLRFELSGSVRNNCERWRDSICKDLLLFLERMAAEPRNHSWARDMEARIQDAVTKGERGKFRIRALECRSTRCALEVASEVESVGISEIDPAFDALMMERPGYFANENDPQTGITTLVSAQVWQTSESFDAEDAATE